VIRPDAEAMSASVSQRRGGLRNCASRFLHDAAGRVAFQGGSITRMQGWSQLTETSVRERFPAASLEFTNAAIGGTNSTYSAFCFDE